MQVLIHQPPRDTTWAVRITWPGCPNKSGCQTWQGFASKPEAKAASVLLCAAIQRGDQHFLDALRRRTRDRLGDLLTAYLTAGAPDRHGRPRAPGALSQARHHIEGPLQWFADHSAARLDDPARQEYWAHRRATVLRGTGDRTTELELGTLNDALHWAWRKGDIKELPRTMRATFRDPSQIAHARSSMPASVEELHALAWHQFKHDAPIYGWLTLFKAFTGLRDEECQLLQLNPQRHGLGYPPGFIDPLSSAPSGGEGRGEEAPSREAPTRYLRITRVKHGCNPRIQLDDPARQFILPLLDMLKQWHATHPLSSAPSGGEGRGEEAPPKPEIKPLFPNSPEHTKSLQRAAKALGLPRRTGHALRAYYATTRLAQGETPETVAHELGQRSGPDLVRDVYGADPDDFDTSHFTSLSNRFRWTPENEETNPPAWHWWTARAKNIVAL